MMKRSFVAAAAVMPLLMVAGMAMAQNASYGYIQSKLNPHNFSNQGWADNQICKPCHTPHNAKPAVYSDRLWAHAITNASYTMDAAGTKKNAADVLDRVSRLCMSCHDGTVALGDYAYSPNPAGGGSPGNGATLGTDLSLNHPVGTEAVYSATRTSMKPTIDTKATDGTITAKNAGIKSATTSTLPLVRVTTKDATGNITSDNFVVGCGSCHHPHGTRTGDTTVNPPGSDPIPHLLRMPNDGSAMCLSCHNK
ncbi:MAG: cytochrome c3 family protein [Planctomycetota bacterium]|nr:cytochrome c3 family protein [Planctomycetota bacterium]